MGWVLIGKRDHQVTNQWFTEFTRSLLEIAILWRRNPQAREVIHDEIISVVRVIEANSSEYRRFLERGLTLDEYEKTRRDFPTLGISLVARNSNLAERLDAG